jgi:hypothetical protein
LYDVLRSVFNLNLNYLIIIENILKNFDKKCLKKLQFYFIKNEFLHFLLEFNENIIDIAN